MLHQNLYDVVLLFLVLVDNEDRLCIIWNRIGCNQCTVLWQYNATEHLLDLLFYLVNVYVTNYDDTLIVRTIPLLVVSLQEWTLEVIDNLHKSYRHAMTVLRTRIELRQIALQHTLVSTCAKTPFFVDNATLFLYLFLFQQQSVCPVEENQQT